MCGIVGVLNHPSAINIVLEGLKRLEYRGYDSAGLATQSNDGSLTVRKAAGKLNALTDQLNHQPVTDNLPVAIGHTRWATHGAPTDANAHPHLSTTALGPRVAVVHNGIIENYRQLREDLTRQGASFASETDTETLPYAISSYLEAGMSLTQAVQTTAALAHGSFAFVAMQEHNPTELVATRRGAPLCIGLSEEASPAHNYLCSDPLALAGLTNRFIFIEDGDVITLDASGVTIHAADGSLVQRPIKTIDLTADLAGKNGFRHFMLKEIHEQPAVVARLLEAYTSADDLQPHLPLTVGLQGHPQVNIVACGTAYYAGTVGKYLIEQLAALPVNVDVASEFRYRQPPFQPGGVFIAVSQSGETADTLAALEHAKAAGQHIIALTNVPTSSIARAAHDVIDLHAGREVSVASTKAFTAMVVTLTLLALELAHGRTMNCTQVAEHIRTLRTLPTLLPDLLAHTKPLEDLAERLTTARSMLYLGRGSLAPLAYEGALKMKEISYIHAEGYASGEMKHGPIALVDRDLPVVNLAASTDGLFDKTLSNLKEVEARHGQVILITDTVAAARLDAVTREHLTLIEVPTVPALLTPVIFTVPLQLLAYYTAMAKGTDVDQPRNLAKSVTVE